MYSAAKYPANHTYKEYQMTIPPQRKHAPIIPNAYKCSVPIKDISEAYLSSNCKTEDGQYAANVNLQEKLQFYHVRSKASKKDNPEDNEELLPSQLSSVSALLLFNSMDSPYEKTSTRSSRQSTDKQQIEDAPDSIVQPWLSSDMDASSSYLYTPTLGEVRFFTLIYTYLTTISVNFKVLVYVAFFKFTILRFILIKIFIHFRFLK